jgi:hypothetical protein
MPPTNAATMTEPHPPRAPAPDGRPPTMRGAVAGSLLVAVILVCAAIGFGVGALVGAPVPFGLAGLFAGVPAGIVLVARRFRDL